MLDELHVTDVALIRDASLCPGSGLTAITGETGAGKTALLGALKLVMGERADASLIREGTDRLEVEARFFERDANVEGHIAARTVSKDGRSRVRIDGAMANVGELAAEFGASIDLCGQHEHQRLMKTAFHRHMLDDWAQDQVESALASYATAWGDAQAAQQAVDAVRAAADVSTTELDGARFLVSQVDGAAPEEGEYDRLAADVPRMENAEALAQAVEAARCALGEEGGALDTLGHAASLLDGMSSVDAALGDLAGSLRDASYVIEDVSRDVRAYGEDMDTQTDSLSHLQERLGLLQGLMRKWGPTMDEVMVQRDKAAALIAAADGFDEELSRALAVQQEAEGVLAACAQRLHEARDAAAPVFAREVTVQMDRLELKGAALECSVESQPRDKWTEQGGDAVEFLLKPGADLKARPLAKIASRGEISRVMLAIKVVLGEHDVVDTLVFDEVDSGVGGSAARALADVLIDLARTHQVLVVTHLAQVAAAASVQYAVEKTDGPDPCTTLRPVQGAQRVHEVARMLSGDATDASLAHARELLDS